MMPGALAATIELPLRHVCHHAQVRAVDLDPSRRLVPRRIALMLGAIALLLVPWTLWLTFTLPTRHLTHHYRGAWVGFDIFLALAFGATAIAALRASEWLQPLAAVTGTMLLCDAWFDVVTSATGDELGRAVVEAVFAELPLAALCGWIVVDTKRFHDAVLRRTTARRSADPPVTRASEGGTR
jgi:hypothetical protein